MDESSLEQKIEALLFFHADAIKLSALVKLLGESESSVSSALHTLSESLKTRGIRLVHKDDEVMFRTAPEVAPLIENARRSELSTELSKAALETLAVILYRGSVTRSEIDYIRGVNSTFILRSLLIRGLIERIPNTTDQRSFLYRPSFDLLGHLGITNVEELPEFATVKQEIEGFEQTLQEEIDDHGESNTTN